MGWLIDLFKKAPIATVVAFGTTALGILVVLQGSGLLHGKVAHWVDAAVGILQIVLTAIARQHVTPVIDPKDNAGRPLVAQSGRMQMPEKW